MWEKQYDYFQGFPMISFITVTQASFSCSLVHISTYGPILGKNASCLQYTPNSVTVLPYLRLRVITFALLDIKPSACAFFWREKKKKWMMAVPLNNAMSTMASLRSPFKTSNILLVSLWPMTGNIIWVRRPFSVFQYYLLWSWLICDR